MKFNEVTRRTLITAIGLCAPRATAALKAGIDEKTLRTWLLLGETDDAGKPFSDRADVAEYVAFRAEFLKAEAEAEHSLVGTIIGAAKSRLRPDWRAASWLLERRHGKRWGYKASVTLAQGDDFSNPDTRAAAINELRAMSPEIVELMIEAWCQPELGHAPAGVRQVYGALRERWGWE